MSVIIDRLQNRFYPKDRPTGFCNARRVGIKLIEIEKKKTPTKKRFELKLKESTTNLSKPRISILKSLKSLLHKNRPIYRANNNEVELIKILSAKYRRNINQGLTPKLLNKEITYKFFLNSKIETELKINIVSKPINMLERV